jgi:signal transduction histidine kinase
LRSFEGGHDYSNLKGFTVPTSFVLTTVLAVGVLMTVLVGLVVTIRARRALSQERAGIFAMLDAVGSGILVVQGSAVLYANDTSAEILKRTPGQLLRQPVHDLLHQGTAADPSGVPCAFEVALRQHQPYRGQERFADGTGRLVPVAVTGTPQADGSGRFVIAFRDRSDDLALGRQREEAFALVSHEVRSPLTAVVGYSNRLNAAVISGALVVTEQRAEEIAVLAREARRMQEIILLILDMAEIERGRVEVEVEPVRASSVVKEEIDRVTRDRPTARFTFDSDDEVVVESDERYVRRIVQNLLENAVKYGGDAVPVIVTLRQEDGGGCTLTVRDYGEGIPVDAQPRIFERFYRHESAAAYGRGLGLGLYLSRRLASRLGGRLTFTSSPGEGAEFSLALPEACPELAPVEPVTGQAARSALPQN